MSLGFKRLTTDILTGGQQSCGTPVVDPFTPYPVVGRSSPSETNKAHESCAVCLLIFTYLAINIKIIIKITTVCYNKYN